MYSPAEIKSRARVELQIVVIEDTELKDRYAVVHELASQRNLYAISLVCGYCVQLPFVSACVQSLEQFTGHDDILGHRRLRDILRKIVRRIEPRRVLCPNA